MAEHQFKVGDYAWEKNPTAIPPENWIVRGVDKGKVHCISPDGKRRGEFLASELQYKGRSSGPMTISF